MSPNLPRLLVGGFFVATSLGFGVMAAGLRLGKLAEMGPGYFPLAVSVLMGGLGVAIVLNAFEGPGLRGALRAIPMRPLLLTLAATLLFGVLVTRVGLAPALFLGTLLAALGTRENNPAAALLIAFVVTAICVLIFSFGLRLPVPLIGA